MNIIQRFKAKTPYKNKMLGRFMTALSGVFTTIETVLVSYNAPIPDWLHKAIICMAIISALVAMYNGQKVKK